MANKLEELFKLGKIAEEAYKEAKQAKKASQVLTPHEGKILMVTQADRTKVGGNYLGGPGFSGLQHQRPEYGGIAWGVKSPSVAQTIIGSNMRVPKGKALWTTMIGDPAQHKSNQHVFDSLHKQFKDAAKEGKLDPALHADINARLASAKDKEGKNIFPDDVDILSKNFKKQANTFDRRAFAADVMGGKGVGGKKGQVFDYEKSILDTTDPVLIGEPTGSLGNRLFTLNDEFSNRPDLHSAFPTVLHGDDLAETFHPAARDILMQDWIKAFQENKGRDPGYYDWTRGYAPFQLLDEPTLRRLDEAGFAKGGKVGRASKIMEELNKAYEEAKAVEKVKAPKVTTTKRSGIKDLQAKVKQKSGTYGAQRVEQAADLVPNLEQQFTENALLKAFTGHGDTAQGLTVMSPAEFEDWAQPLSKSFSSNKNYSPDLENFMSHDEYIDYLAKIARDSGLSDVPYLQMRKDEVGLPLKPYMTGHEGRHRTRALNKLGDKATLIEVLPYGDLRSGLPRMSQEDFIESLKKEMEMQPLVRPEPIYRSLHEGDPRDAKVFPKIFKDGGKVDMEAEFKKADVIGMAEGGSKHKSPHGKGSERTVTAPASFPDMSTLALTGKILARKAKESIKKESKTYKQPRVASDLVNDYIANTLGAPVDLVNMGLSPFGLGSDNPFLGSEQLKRKMREYNLHTGTERPWAETALDLFGPAAIAKGPKVAKALGKEAARRMEQHADDLGLKFYVVKPEGGQWSDGARERVERNFLDPQDNPAVDKWLQTTGRKYVLNRMGSPEDEVRKLLDKDISHIPPEKLQDLGGTMRNHDVNEIKEKRVKAGFPAEGLAETAAGRRWEMMTDEYIEPTPASVYQDPRFIVEAPWAEKLDPDTPIYSGARGATYLFKETGMPEIAAALNRAIKEKKLKPEQLNKVSMEDAVKLTHDQRVKDETELAKDLPKVAEYPEAGMSWQELTHEDPDVLRKVLRREGDIMQNCISGYCDDVLEDGTRLFSLRDKSGNPHVNIEVRGSVDAPSFYQANEHHIKSNPEIAEEAERINETADNEGSYIRRIRDLLEDNGITAVEPEFKVRQVKQIKGKQNDKPVKDYIPFVQDFIKQQGPFEYIDDLSNAGMIDLRRAQQHGVLDDSYPTVMQELGRLFPAERDQFGGINLTSDYGLRADTDVMLKEALKGMEGNYVSPEDIITHMRAQEARPVEQGYSKYYDALNPEPKAKGGQPKSIDLETQFRLADILTR